jgi:hypothetical protein
MIDYQNLFQTTAHEEDHTNDGLKPAQARKPILGRQKRKVMDESTIGGKISIKFRAENLYKTYYRSKFNYINTTLAARLNVYSNTKAYFEKYIHHIPKWTGLRPRFQTYLQPTCNLKYITDYKASHLRKEHHYLWTSRYNTCMHICMYVFLSDSTCVRMFVRCKHYEFNWMFMYRTDVTTAHTCHISSSG